MFIEFDKIAPIIQKLGVDDNEYYIAREDLLPFSFGGNKARKAQYFFKKMDERIDTVVTYGSGSSNHCRVVANCAKSRGMQCVIVSPEENYKQTMNTALIHWMGANIVTSKLDDISTTIARTCDALREEGKDVYFIPGGGHGIPGTEAYANFYRLIKKCGLQPDYIYLASGTGGTQAGLVCGKLLYGGSEQIVGMSIARSKEKNVAIIAGACEEYLNSVGRDIEKTEVERNIVFSDRYRCGGYGLYDDDVKAVQRRMWFEYGIPMDRTYVAKAFSAMQKHITENMIKGKKILFIHTGGTPLFFDEVTQ